MPYSNRMMRPRYNTRRGIDSRPGPGGRMGGMGFGGRGGRGRGRGRWGRGGRGSYRRPGYGRGQEGQRPGRRPPQMRHPNWQQLQQQKQQQGGGRGSFGMGQQMQQFQQQQQQRQLGRTLQPVGGQGPGRDHLGMPMINNPPQPGGQNPGFGQGLPNQNQIFSPLQRPAQEPYANMQQQAARMGQQEPLGQPLGSGLPQGSGGQGAAPQLWAQGGQGRGNIQGTLAGVQGGPMNQYRPGQNFNQRIQQMGARRANPIMGGANPQAMANMQRASTLRSSAGQYNMSR